MPTPVSDPGVLAPPSSRASAVFFEEEAEPEKYCPTCFARHPNEFNVCPLDGAELIEADDLVGQTLSGTYVVSRIVGEGGMGRVYEARHTRIASKRFAIKTLHAELSEVPDLRARFQREAEAAAAIDSPHVLGVFDIGQAPDGRPFLVSELLEGTELADHIVAAGKLSVPFAVHIVRQLCKAVTAAHAVGAIHRDLKPENVFLTGNIAAPTAKILDFGIAKFDDHTALTKTGVILGTPSFMSREQALGERVDHRCDIYALGAILYCALTGRAPFEGDNPATVVVAVLTSDPPRPCALEPSIPLALELVIERAMAHNRDKRFDSAAELNAALAPFDVSSDALAASSGGHGDGASGAAALALGNTTARVDRATREVLLLAGVGSTWLGLSVFNAQVSLLRLTWGEPAAPLSLVLFTLASLLLVGVPSLLLALRIRDTTWPDTTRRPELAQQLRAPVLVAGTVFGLGTFLLRFSELVLVRSWGAAWPGWDPILFVLCIVAAFSTVQMERRRRAGHARLSPVVIAVLGAVFFVLVFVLSPVFRLAR